MWGEGGGRWEEGGGREEVGEGRREEGKKVGEVCGDMEKGHKM